MLRWAGLPLVVILAAPVVHATDGDMMEVPGGMASVSRLLGIVSTHPAEFGCSANRILLASVVPDHDWRDHDRRALLVDYLETVRDLEPLVQPGLEIASGDEEGRRRFADLAERFGYQVKRNRDRLEVIPDEGAGSERRRRLAIALGWDFVGGAHDLDNGVRVAFDLEHDRARAPLDYERWSRLSGRPVDERNALLELATDQRLGLLIEGMRRANLETGELLWERAGDSLYNNAAVQFYRYSASLEVVDGRLSVPGGAGATAMWMELVGTSPSEPVGFITALLEGRGGVAAYLWHALFFAPPETAAYFTGGGASAGHDRQSYVRTLRNRLQSTASSAQFDGPRGLDLGFAAFVRAVPVAADGGSLELPGGAALWYEAVRGDGPPESDDEAAALASLAVQDSLDEGEFILKVLNERVGVDGYRQTVLPRLMRLAGAFRGREWLFTPTNAILVGRAADTQPAALAALDRISIASPDTLRAYLVTVSHLGRLPRNPETHVLVGNFQGGVELLRILDQAGRVDDGVIEERLRAWSEIHTTAAVPEDAAAAELEWIVTLLAELPEAPEAYPGRAPVESALLAAMVPREGAPVFEWRGLDYRIERSRTLAGTMTSNLEVQQIPVADTFVAVSRRLEGLRIACEAADVAAEQREAAALAELLAALPDPDFDPPLAGSTLARQLAPVDRAGIIEDLQKIGATASADRLPELAPRVDDLGRRLGRELRPFLLAPAYLEGMNLGENPLLADPMLVRRHTMVRNLTQPVPGDHPWRQAVLVLSSASPIGSHLAGHVGGVPRALIRHSIDDVQRVNEPAVHDQTRDLWLENAVATRWQELSPGLPELVASLISAGRAVLDSAVAAGPAGPSWQAGLCRRHVPLARLEREAARPSTGGDPVGSWVSPAELLTIGLAAFEESGRVVVPVPVDIAETIVRVGKARAELGDGWRRALDRAGAPTPELTGRGTPWVGLWPPYEAIEREGPIELLNERELIDLRLRIIDYLGRRRLPGEVGGDLMVGAVIDAGSSLAAETLADWEGFLAWLSGLDDDFFDKEMRRCLEAGLYTALLY